MRMMAQIPHEIVQSRQNSEIRKYINVYEWRYTYIDSNSQSVLSLPLQNKLEHLLVLAAVFATFPIKN